MLQQITGLGGGGRNRKLYVPPKRRSIFSRLNGVTSHNAGNRHITTIRISNFVPVGGYNTAIWGGGFVFLG